MEPCWVGKIISYRDVNVLKIRKCYIQNKSGRMCLIVFMSVTLRMIDFVIYVIDMSSIM